MAKKMQIKRELWKITSMVDGYICETEYVKDVWLDKEQVDNPPKGHVYAFKDSPDADELIRFVKN